MPRVTLLLKDAALLRYHDAAPPILLSRLIFIDAAIMLTDFLMQIFARYAAIVYRSQRFDASRFAAAARIRAIFFSRHAARDRLAMLDTTLPLLIAITLLTIAAAAAAFATLR